MNFTVDNMSHLLGPYCRDNDAVKFGNYLESQGWEFKESELGLVPYKDGEEISEEELNDAICYCFYV